MEHSPSSKETLIYQNAPKKMLLPILLEILSRTDKNHPLSQKEIINIIEHTYLIKIDRKTVSRNLQDLVTYHKNICEKGVKERSYINDKTGEEIDSSMTTGYYMESLFDDTELQVLIYNVIFSKHIPQSIKESMIERLESLAHKDFHANMKNFAMLPAGKKKDYNDLFLNLELLNEAIAKHQKISFRRKYIGPDKAPFIQDKTITFTPFKIASSNNEFYVLGTADWFKHQKHYEIDRFRIDTLTDMAILKEPGIDLHNVYDIDKNFDFNTFLSQSPTIVPGKQFRAKMTIGGLRNLSAAIDYFGQENIVRITEEVPNEEQHPSAGVYTVSLNCNKSSLYGWSLNPFNWSYVIEPSEIKKDIGNILRSRADTYDNMDTSTAQNGTAADESE